MTTLDLIHLTRRLDEHRPDCWRIYCGDICAGWIAKAQTTGGQSEWQWSAGFYPGSRPGEYRHGSADTFEKARAQFLPAWLAFASSRAPDDFEEWRDQRDWTERKYALQDRGQQVPIR